MCEAFQIVVFEKKSVSVQQPFVVASRLISVRFDVFDETCEIRALNISTKAAL